MAKDKKKEIIASIESVIHSDADLKELSIQVRELKTRFVELVAMEHQKLESEFISDGGKEEEFKPPHDEVDARFAELMMEFNVLKKKSDKQREHEQKQNLESKKKIIEDLNKLIEEEQHIGHAFEKFNTLKDKWKKTGPVSSVDYRDLQREYSQTIERFFYNINIYKTLKEYDLQKNLELKKELINKVKALLENESIKDIRDQISTFTKDWDEIGPTHQNEWEAVRDEFWESVRLVHKKIADHYQNLKSKQKENFEKKSAFCEEIEELSNSEVNDLNDWKRVQKEIDRLMKEWKSLGFAGKSKNDKLWKRFREALGKLNEKRDGVMKEVKEENKDHEKEKQKLIERANALKDSEDWKNTSNEFKKLQSEWKKAGTTYPVKEQKLWKIFRASADHFFKRRKEYFDGREDREKNNLKKKEGILTKLKSEKFDVKELEFISKEWNAIGYVPVKEKSRLEDAFQKLISEKLKAQGFQKPEIEEKTFELKVEGIKGANNAAELIRNEYQNLKDKLRKIEASIKQYENNLGFFGDVAEDNPLLKEVMDKIENSRKEASKIKSRLEMLEN